MRNNASATNATVLLIVMVLVVLYIVNLVKLFMCDFDAPWKEEIIHAIGVFIPILSPITVWF